MSKNANATSALNYARYRARRMLAISFVASVCLFWGCETRAGDLPMPEEPWLAQPGDWAADFNRAQIACYEGSMRACDLIWLNERVLLDSWLGKYGRSCGGRANLRAIGRANLSCTEAFPDNG
jgi:hypothetical protein